MTFKSIFSRISIFTFLSSILILLTTIVSLQAMQLSDYEKSKLPLELIEAARLGRLNWIQELIDKGVNVNHADNHEWNALRVAACSSQDEACRLLLRVGADVFYANRKGETALTDSGYTGNRNLCVFLAKQMLSAKARQKVVTLLRCLQRNFPREKYVALRTVLQKYLLGMIREKDEVSTRAEIDKVRDGLMQRYLLETCFKK